ncbi:YncE family protein [Algoriphagus mannitolivorans]|uniref:YncE family protein n=1 Tax=Algoriphagus mannitolivorans TaxID=226504 RepID=UPI000411E07D|nr:DUF5074 domain-containing protein [Algoriphagus mannitolivorans]
MKYIFKNQLWALVLVLFAFSCQDGSEKPLGKYETGVLILNEGNFGTNDGEVYHYNPSLRALTGEVFEFENSRPFAGLLEDLVLEEGRLYLVANTGKIEIVNPDNFKSIGAVTGNLDQPRSLATASGKLFVSDYGPYDANYQTPDSYVAVISGLDGGAVKTKIEVSDKPEDLFVSGKNVFVACASGKVEVIDADSETLIKTISIPGKPTQFLEYGGKLWVYSYQSTQVSFHAIDLGSLQAGEVKSRALPKATSRIALGDGGQVYVVTSSGWPNYEDAVAMISLENEQINAAWKKGTGFYGIGYDRERQEVYLANAKGFQGNGEVVIYQKDGTQLLSMEVGRGPSGFLFR